jgi:SAM-dependent methyltransferase
MSPQAGFYRQTVAALLRRNAIARDAKVLVVCGGPLDRDVLAELGFTNVVISNVDTRTAAAAFAPFAWSFQDAEALDYEDEAFDFCIAHSGLHHCRSPHRALLEMYRVARRGLLVFEPCDNFSSGLGVRLGLGQEYEIAAVAANDYRFGGVRNTQVPNYVYRWTEREVVKTINAYAPHGKNQFQFFYALRVPWPRFRRMKSRLVLVLAALAYPGLWLLTRAFPRVSNNFAFAVHKPALPADLHPWLRASDGALTLDRAWVDKFYRPQPAP